ncbi:hypothetical protein [Nocardia sp. NPDC004260]
MIEDTYIYGTGAEPASSTDDHHSYPDICPSRRYHLAVDIGLPELLHYVASLEAAEAFAREACANGWARSVVIEEHVADYYPEMPCQGLFTVQGRGL